METLGDKLKKIKATFEYNCCDEYENEEFLLTWLDNGDLFQVDRLVYDSDIGSTQPYFEGIMTEHQMLNFLKAWYSSPIDDEF